MDDTGVQSSPNGLVGGTRRHDPSPTWRWAVGPRPLPRRVVFARCSCVLSHGVKYDKCLSLFRVCLSAHPMPYIRYSPSGKGTKRYSSFAVFQNVELQGRSRKMRTALQHHEHFAEESAHIAPRRSRGRAPGSFTAKGFTEIEGTLSGENGHSCSIQLSTGMWCSSPISSPKKSTLGNRFTCSNKKLLVGL